MSAAQALLPPAWEGPGEQAARVAQAEQGAPQAMVAERPTTSMQVLPAMAAMAVMAAMVEQQVMAVQEVMVALFPSLLQAPWAASLPAPRRYWRKAGEESEGQAELVAEVGKVVLAASLVTQHPGLAVPMEHLAAAATAELVVMAELVVTAATAAISRSAMRSSCKPLVAAMLPLSWRKAWGRLAAMGAVQETAAQVEMAAPAVLIVILQTCPPIHASIRSVGEQAPMARQVIQDRLLAATTWPAAAVDRWLSTIAAVS